ncbi:serine hydrolase domain-containing protein [Hoyosella subflava]|uniref:6-aminohexanoate-dimer hydrolase n=1 Tax=Hoyosella subflava (strain DSM 45089 / JCM 17490 / NBRC 109087 / DQS3-9A1) TaxID=443218 RepID=F6EJ06_HOYSD|nr:serine hydrolase [Hoyosella subflava]AEF41238.1 6-aminohexanoate-dimer hydrolase [Hoyosella subflava DQS3-9A1]
MTHPVTLANWQLPPNNARTFHRLREVVPTARVAGSLTPAPLPPGAGLDLDLPVPLHDGLTGTVRSVLEGTNTDGFMVLHDGQVRAELYFGDYHAGQPHMLFSVSKSVVSCVAGVLVEQGVLSPKSLVTEYVPELAGSGYDGATVRDILDMRSGVVFSENYLDPSAEVRLLEQVIGWAPRTDPSLSASMYEYLTTLRASRPHGGVFEYRSCETNVLGWVCERAAGERMPELISRVLWSRFAGTDMDAGVDLAGAVMHDGGLAATLRDTARFGELLLRGGQIAGEQLVPGWWIEDALTGAPDSRDVFAASPTDTRLPGGMYRNQFWVPYPDRRVLLCLGIHGQMIFIDYDHNTVVVKLSAWPYPQDAAMLLNTLSAASTIGPALQTGS